MFASGGLETLSEPARGHAGECGQDVQESQRVACELKLDIEMSDIADSIDMFTGVLRFCLAPQHHMCTDVLRFSLELYRRPQV